MKYIFTLVFTLASFTVLAQIPQIARVSKSGTSVIYSDLKKAIAEAQDDDFIYLPGTIIYADSIIFKKRINIVGTGINPDSTTISGRTVINGNVYCYRSGSGGSLQGVAFGNGYGTVFFGSSCKNFTISKCIFDRTANLPDDTSTNYTGLLNIRESVVTNLLLTQTGSSSSAKFSISASNSIIKNIGCYNGTDTKGCSNSTFNNCIFTNYNSGNTYSANNNFKNCIFRIWGDYYAYSSENNRYFNCHIENASSAYFGGTVLQLNTTFGIVGDTFQGGAAPGDFSYTFDYRVKGSSTAAGSGTDGTDKGIYGTMNPFNLNPYNPHIYSKDVAPSTNAQGQLQINVKVKAQ